MLTGLEFTEFYWRGGEFFLAQFIESYAGKMDWDEFTHLILGNEFCSCSFKAFSVFAHELALT
jgi:hypothetical protein